MESSARESSQNHKKRYQMDKKSQLTELKIEKRDLKFVTINMFNVNLKIINLCHNKIKSLPEEISEIYNLQELRVSHNNL